MRRKYSCIAVALAIVLSPCASAWAQTRTDVITLLNGDRITGEIMDLDRGRLQLKTDDAGTLDIEWDKIANIEARRQFEVETSDGRRLLGSFERTVDRVVLVVSSGGNVSLPMPEVTRITAIGASFWAKLDGSVDAGFTFTQSSGIAQTTLNTDTVYRRPAFLFRLSSSATLTQNSADDEADGDDRDDRASLEFSYVRYRGRRLFISGATGFETNSSLGLLLRSQVGGLVGMRLVNTNRAQFEVGSGLVFNDERGVDTEPTQNVEGLLSLRTSYYTYDRPRTTFDADIQYLPQPEHVGPSAAAARFLRPARAGEGLLRGAQRVLYLRQRPAGSRGRSHRCRRRGLGRLVVLTFAASNGLTPGHNEP